MNILIVDDESFVRRSLSDMLNTAGAKWTVAGEAENGLDALDILAQVPIDLIISDIRMPGMDGLSLAQHVRQHYPGTELVLLTGYQDFAYARQAIQYGVKDYLVKPSSVEDILELVANLQEQLEKRKQEAQLNRLRQKNLLEKRLHDLLYGIPLPYFDESIIPPYDSFIVLTVLLKNETLTPGWKESTLYNAVRNIAEDWFLPYGRAIGMIEEQEGPIVLFLHSLSESDSEEDRLLAASFVSELAAILKCSFCLGLSERHKSLESLSSAYRESLQAARLAKKSPDATVTHILDVQECAAPAQMEEHIRVKASRRVISLTVEAMERRLEEDLTLKTIAEELYMNPTYLGRIFKEDIGESFSSFLTGLRIAKAKALLDDITVKVYEVSERVGFKDPAYFSYIFKKHVGITPQDYQKQHRPLQA
ncbi:response regulator transcription factor [Gorillibacterium timonense]|uniref:response regulator transcription factor n=1 Tax=Gorillibacterium timonense TaxID=1689269 RepID=UPI00071C7BD5|nr:response regulator [Gorillibacterium timonense]